MNIHTSGSLVLAASVLPSQGLPQTEKMLFREVSWGLAEGPAGQEL